MSEMTIRLDASLLREINAAAERRGISTEDFVSSALIEAVSKLGSSRLPVSSSILTRSRQLSPISSVDLLDDIRNEGP